MSTQDETYGTHRHESYGGGRTGDFSGGTGFGNRTASDPDTGSEGKGIEKTYSIPHADPYNDSTDYGSGTTSGAGFGNKTGESENKGDSVAGKVMQKVGEMTKNQPLAENGRLRRGIAGHEESQ